MIIFEFTTISSKIKCRREQSHGDYYWLNELAESWDFSRHLKVFKDGSFEQLQVIIAD